jgi:hypothetical protein
MNTSPLPMPPTFAELKLKERCGLWLWALDSGASRAATARTTVILFMMSCLLGNGVERQ